MYKYFILFCFISLTCKNIQAQNSIVTGSLETQSGSSIITEVTTTEEHYYFSNNNNIAGKRPTSIFKTTTDFDIINSIENLTIRGAETEFMSLFKVFSDRILMVSNAQTETGKYIFTHAIDLDFTSHTIIDSIEINSNVHFTALDYKFLNEQTLYTIGNTVATSAPFQIIAQYFELDIKGKIISFESIEGGSDLILSSDYNSVTGQYIMANPHILHLLNADLEIVDSYNTRLPIPVANSPNILLFIAYSIFVEDNLVECIGSSLGPAQIYSNMSSYFSLNDDKIQYENTTPLHPDTVENLRTRPIQTVEDEQGNRYFAYHEPDGPFDNQVVPNKVFISKFDKELNNIYFLELLDIQEHGIEGINIDKQGNLLIIGATLAADIGIFKNSYIKISADGELLTSTGDIRLPETIDIYPNPTTDFIRLNIEQPNADISYYIYTLDGKQATQGHLKFGDSLTINIQALATGMYILHAQYDGQIKTAKFVKK